MRKFILFLCVILALSLTGCTEQEEPPQTIPSNEVIQVTEHELTYTEGVYEVSISASLLYNNSVGNDWRKVYTCDGSAISSGQRWTVPLDITKTVTIDATITENDKWPDVNSASLSVDLIDGFETSTTLTITENKGSYKGNTAQWQITCKVALVDRI